MGSWRGQHSRTAVIGLAFVAFVVCCVLPVAYLLVATLGAGRGVYAIVRLDTRQQGLLLNTACLGIGTAALATAIGAPLGMVLARVPLRRRGLMRLVAGAPVLLPPYIVALAWVNLRWDWLSDWTYSLPSAIVILSLVLYPLAMLATEVALRRIDGRLEEAGLIVASPGRVLRGITLPLVAPSVVAAALVIFVLAVSEFGVPGLLRVRCLHDRGVHRFCSAVRLRPGRCPRLAAARAMRRGRGCGRRIARGPLVTTRRSVAVSPVVFPEWRWPAFVGVVLVIAMALALPLFILLREVLGVRSLAQRHWLDRRDRAQSPAGVRGGDTHCHDRRLPWLCAGARTVVAWTRRTSLVGRLVRRSEPDRRSWPDRRVESAGAYGLNLPELMRCSCWPIWPGSFQWRR